MTLISLVGCAVEKPQPFPSQIALQNLAGVVVERAGALWFQPCNERLWWPVQDNTAQQELTAFYRKFTLLRSEALYVELVGGTDPQQDNMLRVKTVETVGGTAQTCHFRLEGLQYRAASSDPVWVADITADQVIVKSVIPAGSYRFRTANETGKDSPSDSDTLTRSSGTAEDRESTAVQADSAVVAVYRETLPTKRPLEIKILQRRCNDAATGTVLPFTAEMHFFGRLYRGCARKGHPVSSEINGFYWYQPPGRAQVMFKLSADQRVQLVTRDAGGKTVAERGRWQYLQSGKLIFSMRDAARQEYLMLFSREADGQLVLQTGSEHLVSYGATFKLWRPSGLSGGQLLSDLPATAKGIEPGASTDTQASETAPGEQHQALSSQLQPPATQSTEKPSLLTTPQVQAADIDDELLHEIIVNDAAAGAE